jgi:hypothetical protein
VLPLLAAWTVAKAEIETKDQRQFRSTPKDKPRDWMVRLTAASAIGALLAAAFSGWAAYENHNSVVEANRATRAAVWLNVLAEYETADMLNAMNSLRQYQLSTPEFDKKLYDLLTSKNLSAEDSDLAKRIDADRRRVIKFFDKLRILTQ